MKRLFCVIATLIALLPATAADSGLPDWIEEGANLQPGPQNEAVDLAYELVAMVRRAGHKCDTVSQAQQRAFSKAFAVKCNDFIYSYSVEPKGDRWVVTGN